MLTTGGTYVNDVRDVLLDGATHVHYVRSTLAHGHVRRIDVTAARRSPGVLGVFTAHDLDLGQVPPDSPVFAPVFARSFLASDTVRFVGEPIVAIVTNEPAQGPDAAELVEIDFDPLPPVLDPDAALNGGPFLFPEHGSNVVLHLPEVGSVALDECEVVVRLRVVNSKLAPAPIEPRAAAATWTAAGRLHHWTSSQGSHPFRDLLANVYGLNPAQVRVVTPDVGGGFGAKAMPAPEDVLLGWLSRQVGRPVRWTSARSDDMSALGHGRAQIQYAELGGSRDGTIIAYRLTVVQDCGAYPRYGAMLPNLTKLMQPGVYDIARVAFIGDSVVTNTPPVVPYRGAGRPEAAAVLERMVDRFAAEIGADPLDVRRTNLLASTRFPFTTVGGATYDSGDYRAALDAVATHAGYDELRAEQTMRRAAGATRLLGIGISTYVEVTAQGSGSEYGSVELLADGKVCARTGSTPYGTGHETSWAMLVADRLGVPIDDVEVLHGDTDVVPHGGITGGSRSLQIAGSAIYDASARLREQGREIAANLLEANIDDVVLDVDRGLFHVVGSPSVTRGWAEIADAVQREGGVPLQATGDFTQAGPTFPSGAHIAVVEVDAETGMVKLIRYVACDDAGTILNPLIADGQIHGGIAQGVAQALLEEVRFDEHGNPMTGNFADYPVISAAELPSFERLTVETPTPLNELGAKGIGESGTVGATPAVQNAVIDALSHLGVRHIDMPTTPERVWRAIETAGRMASG